MTGAELPPIDIEPISPIDPKSTNPASTNASSASLLAFKSTPKLPKSLGCCAKICPAMFP